MLNPSRARTFIAAAAILAVAQAASAREGVIRKLSYDPEARRVELFEAMEQDLVSVRISPRDEFESLVFVTNKTDAPLTVVFPKAVAAVPVLKQFGQQLGQGNPFNQSGQTGQNQANRNNAVQSVGGQIGASGQQTFNQGIGQGFFNTNGNGNAKKAAKIDGFFCSVPAEKTVQLELQSVCLDHGKRTPTVKMNFELRPIAEHANDPALVALFESVDMRTASRPAIQAAAWNIQNGVPLQTLVRETVTGRHETYGAGQHLTNAKRLIEASHQVAAGQFPAPSSDRTAQSASANSRTRTTK